MELLQRKLPVIEGGTSALNKDTFQSTAGTVASVSASHS